MMKKLLSMILTLALLFTGAFAVYADSDEQESGHNSVSHESINSDDTEDASSDQASDYEKINDAQPEGVSAGGIETEKTENEGGDYEVEINDLEDQIGQLDEGDKDLHDQIENQAKSIKNEIKTQLAKKEDVQDNLKDQYAAALEAGNNELTAQLLTQLNQSAGDLEALKKQFKNVVDARKELVKANYTKEEINKINEAAANILSENPGAEVIGVDSIFYDPSELKFDTPPVIESGRTIVPVRAITQGFGSEVTWDPKTRQITISSGNMTITLTIDSNTALVNGEKVQLDAKAEIINDRSYIPLRFVLEAFDKSVEWDDDTKTIQINDAQIQ